MAVVSFVIPMDIGIQFAKQTCSPLTSRRWRLDAGIRRYDEFFFGCHSNESRNPGLYKETWVNRPALIIIPILNGDIASSIPSTAEHGPSEIRFTANPVVTTETSTIHRTRRSRVERTVEYPSRTHRQQHPTPTVCLFILVPNGYLVIIFRVCCIRCSSKVIARCYTRYAAI